MPHQLFPAELADVPRLIEITVAVSSPINVTITDPQEMKKLIQQQAVEKILVYGKTVGLLITEREPHHIHIRELAVDPRFQGKRIGSAVIATVLARAKHNTVVSLHLHPKNRAAKLYARFGFKVVGIIDNMLGDGEPRHVMERASD